MNPISTSTYFSFISFAGLLLYLFYLLLLLLLLLFFFFFWGGGGGGGELVINFTWEFPVTF